jgi:hypothetical protein
LIKLQGVPVEQKHHYSQLGYQDRETIAIGLENGFSL